VTDSDFKAVERSPVCDHYVSNLVKVVATEDFPIIVSALLPCFWIYMEVGKHTHRFSSSQNPYQAWIDRYVGAEFETAVRQMIALLDELAAS
jgi:thiaminase (transcriptional activator TenA)